MVQDTKKNSSSKLSISITLVRQYDIKNYSHIRKKTINEIVAFVTKYQNQYQIKLMCNVLKINRSTCYKNLHWAPANRTQETAELDEAIKEIFYDDKKRYGAPKIHNLLVENG